MCLVSGPPDEDGVQQEVSRNPTSSYRGSIGEWALSDVVQGCSCLLQASEVLPVAQKMFLLSSGGLGIELVPDPLLPQTPDSNQNYVPRLNLPSNWLPWLPGCLFILTHPIVCVHETHFRRC